MFSFVSFIIIILLLSSSFVWRCSIFSAHICNNFVILLIICQKHPTSGYMYKIYNFEKSNLLFFLVLVFCYWRSSVSHYWLISYNLSNCFFYVQILVNYYVQWFLNISIAVHILSCIIIKFSVSQSGIFQYTQQL